MSGGIGIYSDAPPFRFLNKVNVRHILELYLLLHFKQK